MSSRRPTLLTIAGSDPSGGAGIQADLRTFAALRVFGASVVTLISAQNSLGVQAIWPVAAEQITAQLRAIEVDYSLAAVKIGALGTAAAVSVVADFLQRARPPHVVLDPVLAASGGRALLDEGGRRALVDRLFPVVELVTPNWPEASALTGLTLEDDASVEAAARWLIERGARAVLIKGGHAPHQTRDLLLAGDGSLLWVEGQRVQTFRRRVPAKRVDVQAFGPESAKADFVSTAPGFNPGPQGEGSGVHGTGCVLSAAIAARLAHGRELREAVRDAKRFVEAAIQAAVTPGHGRPCAEPLAGANIFRSNSAAPHDERLSRLRGLYLITDSTLCPDRDAADVAEAGFAGGACAVQLREKTLATPALVALAQRLAARARETGTLFLINDRVDIALAADADGVHVGPDDMPPADARRLLGPERLLGVSVGTVEEARTAAPYASYFGVGAIFGSRTKTDAGPPVTPDRITEIRAAVLGVPVVAIGGIDASSVAQVAAVAAEAAAVVSAVVTAPDMADAVRELARRFWSQ